MNILSFSLFGTDKKYYNGMFKNIELAFRYYPEWLIAIFIEDTLDHTPFQRISWRILTIRMPKNPQFGNSYRMAWRFLACERPYVDDYTYICFRDADSRISDKEVKAVEEWMASGKRYHIMRDHPHHECYPIFGGMWGCRGQLPMTEWISQRTQWRDRLDDMLLLQENVFPLMTDENTVHHSSIKNRWKDLPSKPFPKHEPLNGYIGEVIP